MWTIKAVENKAVVSYYSGRTMVVRGFHVVKGNRQGAKFIQGTAQKWSAALETELRTKAEAFAAALNEVGAQ